MRMFLILWVTPIAFLIGWYTLSYNDLHFGVPFFSRQVHDLTFAIYGNILGVEPEAIPPMLVKALVIDTALVLAFVAFRRRRQIAAFVEARRAASVSPAAQGRQTVQRALEDEGGGSRIDASRSPGARNVGRNEGPFGRDGRQALIPEGDRPLVQP